MHHKIANYLCSNFKHIIIPDYGIKNMKLHSTVNRSMRNLGFYQFLCFLETQQNIIFNSVFFYLKMLLLAETPKWILEMHNIFE